MSDPLSLSISSESPTGMVQGTLVDSVGPQQQVMGRIRGRHLTLRLTADATSVKDRGVITAGVTSDGIGIAGSLAEAELRARPVLRWSGKFTLQQGPAPQNVVGTWQGTLNAVQSLLGTRPEQDSYSQRATFTVTSQAGDGSFSATLLGLYAYLDSPTPIEGTMSGRDLSLEFTGVSGVVSQRSSATISSDWKTITGSLYFDEGAMDYMWLSATFTLQRVTWPV